jgi:replication factor C subunit 1
MDEVDGMSAGDRGGVGALNVLIKKTRVSIPSAGWRFRLIQQIPMVLICNDKTLQKMKPLQSTTFGITFKR